jgi:hypothetical protein
MTTISHTFRRSLTPLRARRPQERREPTTAPRLRQQLIADAVVANYIHDISVRHRPRGGSSRRG